MPINASPEYYKAEAAYLQAKTIEEKIARLEELIRVAPSHKGAENLRAELKTRLKKLKEKLEKSKKSKLSKKGIKKQGFQCVLIGLPNSGKSSLLARLTNAHPKISDYPFTTTHPEIGTMNYQGVKAQIIDMPSIGSENFDMGVINTADALLIVIENLQDLEKISLYLTKAQGKKIIVLNKLDLLTNEQQRKIEETIKSKKLNAIIVSTITNQNIEQLKEKIFKEMHIIRIYTSQENQKRMSQ